MTADPPAGDPGDEDRRGDVSVGARPVVADDGGGGPPALPLGAVGAAAAALLAGIGALSLTGVLGRVQRNNGELLTGAIALVVLGVALSLLATIDAEKMGFKRRPAVRALVRPLLLSLAIVCTLGGVVLGFGTAIFTADDTETPALSFTLDETTLAAKATAEVSNLSSRDRLGLYFDGLRGPPGGPYETTNLYQSFVGPDGDGHASNDVELQVEPGRFDAVGIRAYIVGSPEQCGGEYLEDPDANGEQGTGCLIARLPTRPIRPQLAASWHPAAGGPPTLQVDMTMFNAAAGDMRDAVAMLRVVGVRSKRKKRPFVIHRSLVEPQPGGPTRRELTLPVDAGIRRVCIEGRMLGRGDARPKATCPVNYSNRVAVVDLRVPRP